MTDLATKLEQLEALSENVRVGELEYKDGGEHYCPNILFTPHPMIPNKQRDIAVNFSPAAYGENEAIAKLIVGAVNFVRTELKELVGRARLEALREAEKVACVFCQKGVPVNENADHEDARGMYHYCKAAAIRELEAAIGKPAGKDFIPPQGGEHRD
jgi:hypothetical protein